jgi:hypothetical protein
VRYISGIRHITKFIDVFEKLLNVLFNFCDLVGVCQYFQKLIIGQEIKPRELLPLLLEVVFQTLLDAFHRFVPLFEIIVIAKVATVLFD